MNNLPRGPLSTAVFVLFYLCLYNLNAAVNTAEFSALTKTPEVAARVASYNMFFGTIWPQDNGQPAPNGNRVDAFARLANAVDADVWAFQEMFYYPEEFDMKTIENVEAHFENVTGVQWNPSYDVAGYQARAMSGLYLFSRYPVLWSHKVSGRSFASLIDIPANISDKDLLVVNCHFVNDGQANETGVFIDDVINGRVAQVPADVSLVVCGDFNATPGHVRYRSVMAGQSSAPTNYTPVLNDARPYHLGWTPKDYDTIGSVHFSNGTPTSISDRTIDFMLWRSDTLDVKDSFVINTLLMDSSTLSSYGLQQKDIAMDPFGGIGSQVGCDHYPYLVDFTGPNFSVPNYSQYVADTIPTAMDPGETVSVSVTFRNTGTDTWTSGSGHSLGTQNPQDNTTWTALSRIALTQNVAPDSEYTFTFNITAPMTPGLYDCQFQMVDDINPNQAWFGPMTPNVEIQVGPAPIHIEAENFDLNVGFQTQNTSDIGGGQNIGFTDAGDLLEYNINVIEPGEYHATFRVASLSAGTKFELKSGNTVLCTVDEAATGGFQTWATTSPYIFSLPAGAVTLTVSATGGGWNMNWFKLQPIGNAAPIITSTPGLYAEVGSNYSYTLIANDLEGDTITLSHVSLPSWLSFNSANGLLTGTPGLGDIGASSVSLRAGDGTSNTDQSFDVLVSAAGNDAPVISSTPDTGATIGLLYTYSIVATDADGDTLSYLATTLPGWLSLNTGSGVLSGTPTITDLGMHGIEIAVNDGTVSVPHNFNLVVFDTPSSTNLVLNDSFETGGASPSFWTLGSAAVGSTESFQSGGSSLKITNNSSPTWQVIALESNTDYIISAWILASATSGGSLVFDTEDKFDDPGQTPGGTAQFLGNSSNAAVWTKFEGAFNSGSETSITLRIFGTGSMIGSAYIDDIFLAKASGDNTAPVITSTEVAAVDQGVAYVYNLTAADPDGDTLTFAAPIKPTWLNLNGSVLSGTPGPSDVGDHDVTVTVNDGTISVNQIFTITVSTVDPFETWKVNNGIPIICPDTDCNGNGIVDLIEFALDGTLPSVEKKSSSLDFKIRRNEASVTYIIQKSTDLQNWSDHITVSDSHGVVGADATVPVSLTEMANGKLFLRLRIEN